MSGPKTLFDKIWDAHLVHRQEDGTCLIYIDRHLVHEVTSPQAFEGLRNAGRKVRSPERTLAVADHNVPTTDRSVGIEDSESRIQVEALEANAADFGPEQGFTQPGVQLYVVITPPPIFGALAFGMDDIRQKVLCMLR